MLHLKEALIDQRLPLPGMDVLSDEHVREELEHLPDGDGDVVPALLFNHLGQRMLLDVVTDLATRSELELLPVVGCAGVAVPRVPTLGAAPSRGFLVDLVVLDHGEFDLRDFFAM